MMKLTEKGMRRLMGGNHRVIVEENGKKGIKDIDDQGNAITILEPEYDSVYHYSDSRYIVVRDGKHGLWDGTFVLPCCYDDIIPALMGTCLLIKENGKYGMWQNTFLVPCIFDRITEGEYEEEVQVFDDFKQTFTREYLLLRQDGRYGIWSQVTGYIEPIYDEILPPDEGAAFRVRKDGQWSLLHADGHRK